MTNAAIHAREGYQCPVRGCDKKHNRRYTLYGLSQHMINAHEEQFIKRLRTTYKAR